MRSKVNTHLVLTPSGTSSSLKPGIGSILWFTLLHDDSEDF